MRKNRFSKLYIFCLLILGLGCNHSSKPPAISNITQLRKAIKERFIAGDTAILSHDQLIKILPEVSPPFNQSKDRGGNFQIAKFSYSQASRDYFYADTSYSLIINIADYVVDSTAFFYLFERYENAPASEQLTQDSTFIPNGFAWTWTSPIDTEIQYLEVGYDARYHLSMQTNHPLGTKLLQDVLSSVNWQILHTTDL